MFSPRSARGRAAGIGVVWTATALLSCSHLARAQPAGPTGSSLPPAAPTPMPTPIDGLGADLLDAFTGTNLLFYGGAVAVTGAMAFSGADHAIRVGVQRNLVAPAFADAALYAGYALPATVAPAIYLIGLAAHDPTAAGAGSAALQALATALTATGVLKIAIGRPYPLAGGDPSAPDRLDHPEYARQFRPFQTVWPLPSWPSGHTSATVSIAAALTAYYPEAAWVPFVGYPLGILIGLGMVDGDRHWASDVLAGGLIGHAIGYTIGADFRRRVRSQGARGTAAVKIVPLATSTYWGLDATGSW